MQLALQFFDLFREQVGLPLAAARLRLVEIRQLLYAFNIELLQERLDRLPGAASPLHERQPRPERVALVAQPPVGLVRFGNHARTEQLREGLGVDLVRLCLRIGDGLEVQPQE